jgi:hypothetical protein
MKVKKGLHFFKWQGNNLRLENLARVKENSVSGYLIALLEKRVLTFMNYMHALTAINEKQFIMSYRILRKYKYNK